jgi:hypothetical protein
MSPAAVRPGGLERAQTCALGDAEADLVAIGPRRVDHDGLALARGVQAAHVVQDVVGLECVAPDEVDQAPKVGAAGQQIARAERPSRPPRPTYW